MSLILVFLHSVLISVASVFLDNFAQERSFTILSLAIPYMVLKIKSVAYSSQGSHSGKLDCCN